MKKEEMAEMNDKINIYTGGAEEYDIMVGGEVFEFVVDRLIRHSYPDEKPKNKAPVLIMKKHNVVYEVAWYDGENWWTPMDAVPFDGEVYWWELPEVSKKE